MILVIVMLNLVCCVKVLNLILLCIYSKKKKEEHKSNIISESGYVNQTNTKSNTIRILYGGWVRYYLRRLGNIPSHKYRIWVLRNIFFMEIEENVVIYGGFEIRAPWNIHIGRGSIIGDECKLDGRNGIYISENVNLSSGVWLWTEQHDYNDEYFRSNDKGGKIVIEKRSWVGSRVTVLPNVKIGEGCVIASGAVVTRDCEKFMVFGGVPARKIGERNREIKYEFDGSFIPFF